MLLHFNVLSLEPQVHPSSCATNHNQPKFSNLLEFNINSRSHFFPIRQYHSLSPLPKTANKSKTRHGRDRINKKNLYFSAGDIFIPLYFLRNANAAFRTFLSDTLQIHLLTALKSISHKRRSLPVFFGIDRPFIRPRKRLLYRKGFTLPRIWLFRSSGVSLVQWVVLVFCFVCSVVFWGFF